MAAPTVTGLSVSSGVFLGGTIVTVFGSGFQASPPVVTIAALPQASVIVQNDSILQFTTVPIDITAIAVGPLDVQVTTVNGTSADTSADHFTFIAPAISGTYYQNTNPFFDAYASYNVFGDYYFTGAISFYGPIEIVGAITVLNLVVEGTLNVTGATNLHSTVTLSGIPAGTTADVVYIDPTTKALSYGAAGGGGTITGGTNLGSGTVIFASVSGANLQFKSLVAGTNVTLSNDATTITINASGGGSGWNLTGTNSGAGLKFGTNTADGIDFQVNSINFLTVSSALAMVLAPTGVPSLTIGNASCDLQGNFGNVLLKVNGINFLGVNGSSVMFIGDSAGGSITIEASKLFLANCANSAKSNIVYFDSGTGQLSFGASSSLDGVFLIGGQNFFSDYFLGSLNNVTLDIGTGGVTLISMDAGQNVDISSPGVINVGLLHATEVHIGNATAGTKTYILADDFQLEASGPRFDTLFGSAGIVGIGNINAQHLSLGNIGTAWLSHGTTWTGTYSSDIDIESTTDIFFQASSSGPVFANFELDGAAGVVSIFASGSMRIDGGTIALNTLTTDAVTISASSGTINLSASTINAANLSSGTASNVLYWNSSTKQVTQGASPAAALSWSTVAGTSQTMVAKNAYITGNAGLTTFTLPVTAAVGDEFMVQGNGSGGWAIVYSTGQNIQVGNVSSTTTTGNVSSGNRYDVIKLVCAVANTSFNAEFLVGTLSIT